MSAYCVTRLDTYGKTHCNDYDDLYWAIYRATGNHELAEEMASWAENAPIGDNWTSGDIDVCILGGEG